MESPQRLARPVILLVCLIGIPALADNSPELPDQYAEVVLRVEGMI